MKVGKNVFGMKACIDHDGDKLGSKRRVEGSPSQKLFGWDCGCWTLFCLDADSISPGLCKLLALMVLSLCRYTK